MIDQTPSIFPKNFLWGAATSAHQVEGNNHNDWTEWEKLGRVQNRDRSGLAAGHYSRFKEDFVLAKSIGHNAHRLSIEWSRIIPRPGDVNEEEIEHYRQVLEELRRQGLTPMVTLHHFTNPIWIAAQGGWINRKTIDDFGHYVTLIAQRLGHLVDYWITINEPTVYTTIGYLEGRWPPNERHPIHAWQAIRNLADAHRLAYQILHRHFPHSKVGVANNLTDFTAARPRNPFDRFLQKTAAYWHNRWWLDRTATTQDFLGLNYYFHHALQFRWGGWRAQFYPAGDSNRPKNDLGWEIHPSGLGRILESLREYQRPIIITENGIADSGDRLRPEFIRDHLAYVERAIDSGIDIRGYFHWSLVDNFEWAEGFSARFGLAAVDYATMARTPRQSAYVFREVIRSLSS